MIKNKMKEKKVYFKGYKKIEWLFLKIQTIINYKWKYKMIKIGKTEIFALLLTTLKVHIIGPYYLALLLWSELKSCYPSSIGDHTSLVL